MNIEELLAQVKQVKEAQGKGAEGEAKTTDTDSTVPQKLTPDPKNCLPKNIVAEGEQGDPAKIEELLNAIAANEETKGAAEALLTAKLAEEAAAQDQEVIYKQAEFFGGVMADAILSRFEQLNQVTEKEAEAQMESWKAAGAALAEGYLDKLAMTVQQEATDGVLNTTAAPAAVNEDAAAEVDEKTLDYIAAEMAKDIAAQEEGPEAPKNASEKEAGIFAILKDHIRNLLVGGTKGVRTAGTAVEGAGKAVYRAGGMTGKAVGRIGMTAGKYTKKNPYVVGGGALAAGGGYAAGRLTDKESSEKEAAPEKASAESIVKLYLAGEMDVKAAADALRPAA